MVILNKKELAKYLDPSGKYITAWTIFRWYTQENMPCIRIGRRVLFNTDSVDAWLKERESQGRQEPEQEYGKLRRID